MHTNSYALYRFT